jgi:hypothetical protein
MTVIVTPAEISDVVTGVVLMRRVRPFSFSSKNTVAVVSIVIKIANVIRPGTKASMNFKPSTDTSVGDETLTGSDAPLAWEPNAVLAIA